jgi:hypothetical protein
MNSYVSLHAGKKFWNLFHLQPMRDQKVAIWLLLETILRVSWLILGCNSCWSSDCMAGSKLNWLIILVSWALAHCCHFFLLPSGCKTYTNTPHMQSFIFSCGCHVNSQSSHCTLCLCSHYLQPFFVLFTCDPCTIPCTSIIFFQVMLILPMRIHLNGCP